MQIFFQLVGMHSAALVISWLYVDHLRLHFGDLLYTWKKYVVVRRGRTPKVTTKTNTQKREITLWADLPCGMA